MKLQSIWKVAFGLAISTSLIPFVNNQASTSLKQTNNKSTNSIEWALDVNDYIYPRDKTQITGEIVIPVNVGETIVKGIQGGILGGAFQNCKGLTKVSFENDSQATVIGQNAFYGCSSLDAFVMANSITTINEYAFHGCSALDNITFSNNLKIIGNYAFNDCDSLKTLILPNSLTTIGNHCFASCNGLITANVPNQVTSLPENVFNDCSKLQTVNINSQLTTIGGSAFQNCYALNNLVIPDTVTEIGHFAFSGDNVLTSILIRTNVTDPLQQETLYQKFDQLIHNTSSGFISFYSTNLENWTLLFNDANNKITGINESQKSRITNLVIPNQHKGVNITSIMTNAFANNSVLESFSFPSQQMSVESKAFSNLKNNFSIHFNQTNPTEIAKLNFANDSFSRSNQNIRYEFITPLLNDYASNQQVINAYQNVLNNKLSTKDIILPQWEGISFSDDVISNIDNDSFKTNATWSLRDSLTWTTTKFNDKVTPETGDKSEYSFSIIDENNQPVTDLPKELSFNNQTAEFTLGQLTKDLTYQKNNLRIKVEDNVFGYSHISTKTFNIDLQFNHEDSGSSNLGPILGGVFGGITAIGLIAGGIVLYKKKKQVKI